MTPHSRFRKVSSRHFQVLLPFSIWCLGGLLPAPLPAGPVPAHKPQHFPDWWFERDVIKRTNPAIAAPSWQNGDYPASDDFAAVNQGQVKAIVTAAVAELNSRLTNVPDPTSPTGVSNGAGQVLNDLVAGWEAAPAAGEKREDFAAVNVGQLKTIATLIYDRLISAGYYDQIPWAYGPGGANDFAAVNLGQLKQLFCFNVSVSPLLLDAITHDLWTGINGTDISSIPPPPSRPSPSSPENLPPRLTTSLERQDEGGNYAERIRGYLTVEVSGIYRFWLTASGSAELYISNDADPVNSFLRAEVKSPTGYRGWTDATAGKSALLRLEKGRRYYVEVLHKAGAGPNHVSVGWLKATDPKHPDPDSVTVPTEVVPASALSLRVGGAPPAFTPPPSLAWSDPLNASSPESHLNRDAAARFLVQSTYGPSGWATDATYGTTGGWTNATLAGPDGTPYDIAQVQALGFEGWIDQQIDNIPRSKLYDYVQLKHVPGDPNGNHYWHEQFYASWWRTAVTGRDQLRQRVAFALSEIMVISAAALNPRSDACSDYYDDALAANAFGNFRDILKDVTLHPAMGLYLNMLRNKKPNPTARLFPNENYARELLQLFSIGTSRLNPDGTLLLNAAGQPIPTYDQEVVEGLAHTFTGWDFDYVNNAPGGYPYYPNVQEWIRPMKADPNQHSIDEKDVLNNVVLPGLKVPYSNSDYQQLPAKELDAVLDAIFKHPNCGPFICRQLIQRLVTSHPSPGYVYRVVSKFNDDGSSGHVRGNMRAVIKAILLDPEARSASRLGDPAFGKQREPVCRITALARAFPSLEYTTPDYTVEYDYDGNPATTADTITKSWVNEWNMRQTSFTRDNGQENLNQTPLAAPSVFNFFRPDYQFPGILARAGLTTPEFQLTTDTSVIDQANVVHYAFFNWAPHTPPLHPGLASFLTGSHNICMDLRPWMGSGPNNKLWTDNANLGLLVDRLNSRLMGGQLPSTGTNVYHPGSARNIVNAKQAILDFVSSNRITGVSPPSPLPPPGVPPVTTITVEKPHGLVDGDKIFFKSSMGGSFSPVLFGGAVRPFDVTVTSPDTFTIPVQRDADNPSYPLDLANVEISRLPYDTPRERLFQLVNLLVNSPDFIIQR